MKPLTIFGKTLNIQILFSVTLALLVVAAIILRLLIFEKVGGDYLIYKEAVNQFRAGINPYHYTVLSYNVKTLEHGYAYLPTLLYLQYFVWIIGNLVNSSYSSVYLWKIPTLISELAILYLILRVTKPETGALNINQAILRIGVVIFWLFNPYLIARYDYALFDPVFLLVTFLSLLTFEKRPLLGGVLFALAVSLKTIPVILFPLYISFYLAQDSKLSERFKKIVLFGLGGLAVLIAISIPFLKSFHDFYLYVNGSFLVQTERSLQGRPLLTTLSYLLRATPINFYQVQKHEIYSFLAIMLSTFLPAIIYLKNRISSKYTWVLLSFGIYLALTPVLSRTHLLWFVPWFLVVLLNLKLNHIKALVILTVIWLATFLYLFSWNSGFETYVDNAKPVLRNKQVEWELTRILRHRYYELRDKL